VSETGVNAMGVGLMAKELKLSTVKIETTVLRKAKTVADRLGLPVSTYLSKMIEAGVERDLDTIYKRLLKRDKEKGGEE
jgi:hypothetical protein